MVARVRRAVDRLEAGGVDAGVALRRRERGVAEEFLDAAQIAPGFEQVGGEAVAQRVRCRALGQAEHPAQHAHLALYNAGVEALAARADEQRVLRREAVGTNLKISVDRREDLATFLGQERLRRPADRLAVISYNFV